MQNIGKINLSYFENDFGKLKTDEVVLTNEREAHIKNHHPQDYIYLEKYGAETVKDPDIILVDSKNISTALLIKRLPETNINVALRLAMETDTKDIKNSIMTFYRVRDSFLKKMLKKHKVIYKRE